MIRQNRKRRLVNKGRAKGRAKRRAASLLRRMGRAFIGAAGLAGVLACAWWLNQALSVERWTIRGVPEHLETAIDTEMKALKPLDFVHAWPSRLRGELLKRLPDLADVEISRKLPGRVKIIARKRVPVALWQGRGGKVWLVDGHAVAYRVIRHGEQADLPLLRTSVSELGDAVSLMLTMKQEDNARYAHLSELIAEGASWRMNFERGQSWLLPHNDGSGQRMRDLIVLMHQKRWRGGNWRIDARMPARWFIRRSKIGGVV